jgi:DNA-3-methyladenine glycosylase II
MSHVIIGIPSYWDDAKQHLRAVDGTMGALIDAYEDPPLRSQGRLFETLARAIIGQQISAKAADAVWSRFKTLVGTIEAENVLRQTPEALFGVGLSRRKVEYVRTLAEQEDWLSRQPWTDMTDAQIVASLCSLRGVGPWTAEMMLIFSLLRPDVLPLGDIGIIRSIENHYANGARLSEAEVVVIAAVWQPYRTVGVWYLWRSLDAEPVLY